MPTTVPCCSIEFIESLFLFWVVLVTYSIGIYIYIYIYVCIYIWYIIYYIFNNQRKSIFKVKILLPLSYIYKVSYIHSFLLSSTVMFFLHCMLSILRYEKIFCDMDELIALWHDPSSDVILLGVVVSPFFLLSNISFLQKIVFLLLIAESISLDTSGKSTTGFSLKITSSFWIILSVSLDGLNSIDWLIVEELMNNFLDILFYCWKRILIWQKILEVLWRLYLNIIFWISLWMLTSLVICEYYPEILLRTKP